MDKKKVTVGILAHVDAGKTTLIESMLYQSHQIRTLGRVDHQDAFLDFDHQERQRGITIFSKEAHLEWKDTDIYVIDTPGHIDFSAEHIMILEQFAPWQGIVTSESRNNPKAQDIWYVVSPALRGGWNVQCVLDNPDDLVSYRHPLPQSWYGLRNEELQAVSGIKDARFCHPSGFLAGADSQAGALGMAYRAIGEGK